MISYILPAIYFWEDFEFFIYKHIKRMLEFIKKLHILF